MATSQEREQFWQTNSSQRVGAKYENDFSKRGVAGGEERSDFWKQQQEEEERRKAEEAERQAQIDAELEAQRQAPVRVSGWRQDSW